MAKQFIKDVMRPGVYNVNGRAIPVTADDLKRWVSDYNEMKSLGLKVSVPFEHPDSKSKEAYPVLESEAKEREKSRLHAGWMDDLFIEDGVLRTKVELGTKEAIEQADGPGTFVSPQFGPWEAPNGKKFANAITHLALTTLPRVTNQSKDFVPVVAMSQLAETISFSLADLSSQQTQFSDQPPNQQQPAVPPAAPPAQPPAPAQSVPGQQSNDPIGQLKQALTALGVTITEGSPVGKDPEALAAILSCVTTHHGQQAANQPDPMNPSAGGKPGDVREEPRTVMMSQQTPVTPTTPAANPSAPAATATPASKPGDVDHTVQLSQANSRISALEAELTTEKQDKYKARINAAFAAGKCGVPKRDALLAIAGTFQFSAAAPQSKGELDFRLEEIESNLPGAAWSDEEKIKQFSVREESPNRQFFEGGDISDKDADELVERLHPMARPSGSISVATSPTAS